VTYIKKDHPAQLSVSLSGEQKKKRKKDQNKLRLFVFCIQYLDNITNWFC